MPQLGGGKGTAIGGGEEPEWTLSAAGEGVENAAGGVGTCGGAEGTGGDTGFIIGEAEEVEGGV